MANEAETTNTTQAGGVPDTGAVQPAGQGIANAQQSGGADAAKPKGQSSWTDDPKFREQQSKTDKTIADLRAAAEQARQEAANAKAQTAALAQQRELERLEALDPTEQAKALRDYITQQNQQAQQVQEQQAQMAKRVNAASTKANDRLAKVNAQRKEMGLDALAMDDTRLIYEGNTPEERLASFFASLTDVTTEDAAAALASARKAGQQQVVQALEDAGVPKTSGANSTPTSSADKEATELRARWKKLKGTGNQSAFWELQRKAEKLGISLD